MVTKSSQLSLEMHKNDQTINNSTRDWHQERMLITKILSNVDQSIISCKPCIGNKGITQLGSLTLIVNAQLKTNADIQQGKKELMSIAEVIRVTATANDSVGVYVIHFR